MAAGGGEASSPLTAKNPKISSLRRLIRRRSERVRAEMTVAEGPVLVTEALAAGRAVEVLVEIDGPPSTAEVVAAAEAAGVPVTWLARGVVERIGDVVTPQPVLATVRRIEVDLASVIAATGDAGFIVVLAGVADPGNVGTLLRTAEAAGAAAVVLTPSSVDVHAPKVVRASAGSAFRVPVATEVGVDGLTRLADAGLALVGARAREATAFDEAALHGPLALVLGSEAHGVPDEVAALVTRWVRIPLAAGVESLNVATAGAVLAFEVARRRRGRR